MTTPNTRTHALLLALAAHEVPCLEPRGEEHKECMSCDGYGRVVPLKAWREDCGAAANDEGYHAVGLQHMEVDCENCAGRGWELREVHEGDILDSIGELGYDNMEWFKNTVTLITVVFSEVNSERTVTGVGATRIEAAALALCRSMGVEVAA